ncbi:hypothetical protein ABZ054_32250, partial [Streptomyces sp. NPDC006324]
MLRPSPAPAPALRSVLAALGSPTAVREARTPALRAAQGPLSPELPLPVHVLGVTGAPGHPPRTRLAGRRLFDHAETVSAGSLDRIAALGGAVSVQNRMSF